MPPSRLPEALYDSEAMLRLVDRELQELRDDPVAADPAAVEPAPLVTVLQRANAEIGEVLATLRDGRQALHEASLHKLHAGTEKLREVSSATEVATTTILDGLDRAQGLVDQLDALDAGAQGGAGSGADPARGAVVRAALRDELFAMVAPLQFQDITTQQLEHVSAMMGDVERQLRAVAALLDCSWAQLRGPVPHPAFPPSPDATFAASASTADAAARQAQADALFWAGASPTQPPR